mgnify:FL=1
MIKIFMQLSRRIQDLAKSEEFLLNAPHPYPIIDFSSKKRSLKLSLEIKEGKICHFSYHGDPSTLEKAILEAFGKLNVNNLFWELKGLEVREMKNFLKDFNDVEAFSKEYKEELDEILSIFPIFIGKIFTLKVLLEASQRKINQSIDVDFGDKLEQLQQFYKHCISPVLGSESSLEDIYQWDEPYLSFLIKEEVLPPLLRDLLFEVYSSEFQLDPLKVVAVKRK